MQRQHGEYALAFQLKHCLSSLCAYYISFAFLGGSLRQFIVALLSGICEGEGV